NPRTQARVRPPRQSYPPKVSLNLALGPLPLSPPAPSGRILAAHCSIGALPPIQTGPLFHLAPHADRAAWLQNERSRPVNQASPRINDPLTVLNPRTQARVRPPRQS